MGYYLNHLDEPVFMAVSKPLLTEFGIHHRLESCVKLQKVVHLGYGMVKNESCTAIPHFKMIHTAFALKSKGNFRMSNFAFRS